jgi:hypothetical protein
MRRARSKSNESDVRAFPGCYGADVLDVDLSRDHLVSKGDHDRCDEREAILALVRDQDARMLRLAIARQRATGRV